MEKYTNTMTAWTPSFGMSLLGRPCAHTRAFGAAVVAVQGDAAIVRIKGDFPGSPAWSPSS
ncbi:hypothetical protein Q9S36_50750 [Microbacterium sp. ARD31]|jgi:hypothetical protein|uniref:hypothetical protein n=1 Tax=Microbacterium sp. ARD31 TaxID=2962576 RepID=UPI0028813E85|nr:hypothetical protein [Microbacterium sp. ARD31]MDT0188498.1 hypothetical protein [Microbacterium sp. ARD31]